MYIHFRNNIPSWWSGFLPNFFWVPTHPSQTVLPSPGASHHHQPPNRLSASPTTLAKVRNLASTWWSAKRRKGFPFGPVIFSQTFRVELQKIGGFLAPKMDGENHAKPYELDDFGGTTIFGNTLFQGVEQFSGGVCCWLLVSGRVWTAVMVSWMAFIFKCSNLKWFPRKAYIARNSWIEVHVLEINHWRFYEISWFSCFSSAQDRGEFCIACFCCL